MAIIAQSVPGTEAAILDRLIHPVGADLSDAAAHALLELRFDQQDLDRLHDLVTRDQEDALAPAERSELESDLRIGSSLGLVQAQTRLSLKKHA